MQSDVDRPTAVANALAAAVTDAFEEGPGPDCLKHEHTARNRFRREVKHDKMRNLWLQRLYDGTFFLSWHVFVACARCQPISFSPIRPYNDAALGLESVSLLVVEVSCAIAAMCTAFCDALCAFSTRPELPKSQPQQPPQPPQPPQTPTAHQRMYAPCKAGIGTPIALKDI